MENKIKLVRGRIEEVTLNEPIVDVLVSEWMGYFLLFEGMLDSVIHARNKYLAPNGIMLPNSCSISIMAVGDSGRDYASKTCQCSSLFSVLLFIH